MYIVENIYWPRLIILKRFCSITVSYSVNFYANIAVFDHFWTVFLIFFKFLTAKNTCVHSREHSLTVTKHWQCFWAIIVTYGVHFHVNFTILGCFWPFLGRFLYFFFFKAKITCVYSREHILTITKHLQPLCAIIVTYSIHFYVNFIVLGSF